MYQDHCAQFGRRSWLLWGTGMLSSCSDSGWNLDKVPGFSFTPSQYIYTQFRLLCFICLQFCIFGYFPQQKFINPLINFKKCSKWPTSFYCFCHRPTTILKYFGCVSYGLKSIILFLRPFKFFTGFQMPL